MSKFPLVSVIIPTRNRKTSLLETLQSLSKLNYPKKNMEIIVVDNGSKKTQSSKLKTENHNVNLKTITNKKNLGFAKALNQGIRKSKGKYILVTNDDVIFDENCLTELIKVINLDPQTGIVGPRMYFRKSKTMALPYFRVNLWLGYHPYDSWNQNTVREMDVATGGCMLIKDTVFDKIGLFDEGFFFCGEDYDFCFRAKKAGFKIMYSPKAVVWHGFLGSGGNKNLTAHYKGKFRFMLKHASLPQILFFFPIQFIVGLRHIKPITHAFLSAINIMRVNRKKGRSKLIFHPLF